VFSSDTSRRQSALLVLALVWVGFAAVAIAGLRIGDEWVHFEQISRFRSGHVFDVVESLTTFPGYHGLVAGLMWLFGGESLGAARATNIAFGMLAVAMFFVLRRTLHPGDAVRATAQLSVCPPIFVYVFLAYTDVPSLALVLAATSATLKRAHVLSAALLVASIGIRQNNIVWVCMLAVLAGWPILRRIRPRSPAGARELIAVCWPYLLPALAFAALWAWRGSISFSASQASLHPDLQAHAGNVVFAAVVMCLLLPLQMMLGAKQFVARARRRPVFWLLPVAAASAFALFFEVDHPYNHVALHYNPRNAMLVAAASVGTWAWCAFGVASVLAVCGVAGTRLVRQAMGTIVPFSLLFLAGSWLIETRYLMIPLALWLASREPASDAVERATLALWLIVAVYLGYGVFAFRFML
jgi:alpha-1,2-glucosyltransferase